jgi:FixJ family two-component response regulator
MRQSAAVMCRDNKSLETLQAALAKLEMRLLPCQSGEEALEMVVSKGCSTLIVDFDLPGAQEVVRMAALLPPAQKPTLLAVASRAWPGTGEAFHSGASRILYRPIAEEQVQDALQAGKKHGKKPRKSARYEMKTVVHLECDSHALTAISIDISEHGLAVQATEPVPMSSDVAFRCTLPGSNVALQGHAEVIWASDQGRAGMFFSKLSPAARKHLKQWLSRRSANLRAHRGKDEHSVRDLLPSEDKHVSYAASE